MFLGGDLILLIRFGLTVLLLVGLAYGIARLLKFDPIAVLSPKEWRVLAKLMATGFLFFVLILVILRLVLRRTWLAVAAFFVLGIGAYWPAYSSPAVHLIFLSLFSAIFLGVLFRFGFLSIVVFSTVQFLLIGIPISFQVTSWTFGGSATALVLVVGLAIYGLRISLAGRPLFPDELAVSVPVGTKI